MSDQQSPDVKDTMAATRDSDSCTASVVYTIELIENDPFYCDDVMRDVLVEAFESWSVADLMSVRPGHLPKLRNLSMDRGVYIRNHTVPGGSLAQSIFDAFNAKNPLRLAKGHAGDLREEQSDHGPKRRPPTSSATRSDLPGISATRQSSSPNVSRYGYD
ncbi:hypothetical protein SEPCBS57363_001752 [Sporothrix epigloea]|uniref:Uncharacterized protein n=1 Tax=Sporothrix epigloea TaxID=1892477 RepID=A0ABP0DDQ4_9PEZI